MTRAAPILVAIAIAATAAGRAPAAGEAAGTGAPPGAAFGPAGKPPIELVHGVEGSCAEPAAEAAPAEAPGPVYTLEGIRVEGNRKTSRTTILFFVSMKVGEIFEPGDPRLEKSRYALLATGWFGSVDFSLEKGTEKGRAVLVIRIAERSTLVIRNFALGFTKMTPFVGLALADHNFLGRGINLGGGFVVGDPHFGVNLHFLHPFVLGSRFSLGLSVWWLSGNDYMGNRDILAYWPGATDPETRFAEVSYVRRGGIFSLAFDIASELSLSLGLRFEVLDASLPAVATHVRLGQREPIEFGLLDGRSYLTAISAALDYDSRDDPFLPSRGIKLSFTADLSSSILGSSYSYAKLVFSYDHHIKLPWKHVLRLSCMAGLVTGNAPFFEQFYVGDFTDFIPDRVMGMAFDHRRSPNLLRTVIPAMRYEDIAARLSVEYVIGLLRGQKGVIGLDFFVSVGIFTLASAGDIHSAANSETEKTPFPLDLTTNFGFRVVTTVGFFEFSLSNLIGLVPLGGG